jgi:tRNA threonylcarbamoyladenosine biosynthesis protein TsaB
LLTFALDTATPSPGLALLAETESGPPDPLAELWLAPAPGAGRRVLEAAHGLLGAAGVDLSAIGRIVVGTGPGGFTGLRIGIATALGLGQALRVPVLGASSLEALALGVAEAAAPAAAPPLVVPAIDARRGEVFAAVYRALGAGRLEELEAPAALTPEALAARVDALGEEVWLGGDGVPRLRAALGPDAPRALPDGSPGHRVRAAHLAARVAAAGPRPAVPEYARLPDAEVNRRAARAGRPEPTPVRAR